MRCASRRKVAFQDIILTPTLRFTEMIVQSSISKKLRLCNIGFLICNTKAPRNELRSNGFLLARRGSAPKDVVVLMATMIAVADSGPHRKWRPQVNWRRGARSGRSQEFRWHLEPAVVSGRVFP